MKELLYNIIFLPLPFLWLLILILTFRNKINVLLSLKIVVITFYIILTPIFSIILEYPLTKGSKIYSDGDIVSYVLVPTAGIFKDAKSDWYPSSISILRLKRAELIAEKLKVPLIVSGGGTNTENIAEANVLRKFVTYENTIYEVNSKNSYETAVNLKNILLNYNIDTNAPLLLVTSAIHTLRMSLTLKTQGYHVINYKNLTTLKIKPNLFIPDSRAMSNKALYEYLGLFKYIYTQYIEI